MLGHPICGPLFGALVPTLPPFFFDAPGQSVTWSLLFFLQVKLTLSQKDAQLETLQQEHLELMRQLTDTQESLHTKEQSLNQLEARYLELEGQLAELQSEATTKEDTIQFLQNEKIVLEVALQAARADKSQLDEGAEKLGEEVLVAADILDQLKQEVQVKAGQVSVQDLQRL